ncbi:MAG TPA: tetratricopeptide repeat protein, partial [Polyangia bacterium]|nr:tetratricopeptide repeat protein [Polyangia bacterium]
RRGRLAGGAVSGARRVAALAALVLLTAAGGHPAVAAMSAAEREARHRFDEAEVQYRAGHYADALVKYQAGYAAMPLPGFLINIAQCQRRLGDLKTARATYREFVLVAPDSHLVPEVQALIRQLDSLIADLTAGGAGASAAQIGDGADVHATDPDAPPDARPDAPGAPSLAAPDPNPQPVLVGSAPPPPHRARARWWIWGSVAAAAIAGGVVTGLALSSSNTTTVHAGSLGTLSR